MKESLLSKKTGKAEWWILLLYVLLVGIVSYFHEPFFDEAQAWMIARSASWSDMLTVIPHYEGHPPLWHLILAPFARSGAPYELSLKAINLVFSSITTALILFRSPFPKIVRCLLPFNYFFFYQYGVISRPYSISMLAFMLMAMTYSERKEKPWKYVLSMTLLCLSTMLGFFFAGGLCIVWTAETILELKQQGTLRQFFKDKRFWMLAYMLLLAISIYFVIKPAPDIYYAGVEDEYRLFGSFFMGLALFLILPSESWVGTYAGYSKDVSFSAELLMNMFLGALFWALLIMIAFKNQKLFTFLIPYFMFDFFFGFFYSSVHHIGLSTGFHVFLFWAIAKEQGGKIQLPEWMFKAWEKLEHPKIRKTAVIFFYLVCLSPVFYSVATSIEDIGGLYAPKNQVEFIKRNHLENNGRIMTVWDTTFEHEENENQFMAVTTYYMPSDYPEILAHYPNQCGNAVTVQPYFENNVFMNFNLESPGDLYMHYSFPEDYQKIYDMWEEKGLPDFIFHWCPIQEVYTEEELEGIEYVCVEEVTINRFFKFASVPFIERLFIRKDLLDEYPDLTPLYP